MQVGRKAPVTLSSSSSPLLRGQGHFDPHILSITIFSPSLPSYSWRNALGLCLVFTFAPVMICIQKKSNCFTCLVQVQGVSTTLSKAVSCLDKLPCLGRNPQGGVVGRRQKSKTLRLVNAERGWNVCLLDHG